MARQCKETRAAALFEDILAINTATQRWHNIVKRSWLELMYWLGLVWLIFGHINESGGWLVIYILLIVVCLVFIFKYTSHGTVSDCSQPSE